jgi:hypothetical protein
VPSASDPLLVGLVDDAALFPPGNAAMAVGLAEHAGHRRAPWAAAVGPFLCPASRVDELRAALPGDQAVQVSLVFDVVGDAAHAALRACAADDRLTLVGVEAALARLGDDASAVGGNLTRLPGVTGYLEVPRTGFTGALDLVEDGGWHAAKYRTGGVSADAYPAETELSAFLVACARRALPFKLTAGLHRAVRNTTAEGFEQHGVLNVLVAVAEALNGVTDVAAVLADRDGRGLARAVTGWDERRRVAVRQLFRSFGCCGVTDPLDDLRTLGVLEEE